MKPLPAPQALDQYFLDARARLLDLAAILDRVGRGANADTAAADPRLSRIRQALEALLAAADGRAERVQQIFSLEYDPTWKRPEPRF